MNINTKPLFDFGLSESEVSDLMIFLQGQVSLDLFARMKESFSVEDKQKIESELSRMVNDVGRVDYLESFYLQKTGQSLTDSAKEILQEYLDLVAKLLVKGEKDLDRISRAGEETVGKLETALKGKDYPQVKAILDRLLTKN